MSHVCWRYSTNATEPKHSFSCSCGCCGEPFNRYCCDATYCDPNNRGYYLSEGTVAALLCIVVLVIIGAIVALILVCRMKKRPFTVTSPDEKSKELFANDKDYSAGEIYNPDLPYYIQTEQRDYFPSEQRRMQDMQDMHMQNQQQRQISSC